MLFDVDGTLIDSSYIHTLCWWQAFRQAGYDVPMASIHRSVGMGGDRLISHLLPDDRDRAGDEAMKAAHGALFSAHWPGLRPFEAASELLTACADLGLAVALASSAQKKDLEVLRSVLGADAIIDAAASSSDAKESKPDPDILLAAMDALDLKPSDVVFVGDAVWDVYAAAKLDIGTIALTCGGTSAAELRDAGAIEVYEDPRDLLKNLSGSAIGKLLSEKR